ncbi:complex I NDUFA9 subunit family protein [Sphingomonas sp. FW199]|uniref:complex I NDUFA9 subunit family protein n=1 Tax=Sphingomonas sp. FW199 TaxID=3400217 RepID=UPI003CE88512
MQDRLITLFGGGGFLGRYIAQELLAAGARVRIAQRDPRKAFYLKPLGGLGQVQFVAADITRPDRVARAIAGSDAVVNLVGILNGRFDAVHAVGAGNVARAAADAGVSALVQISALGADAGSPSAYGRSKAAGEAAVLAAFPAATILRPSIVFGREDQFVNRFAGMIAAAPVVPVLKADAKFQPVYVADVAQAVVRAIADPGKHGGKTYALGGPDIITMGGLNRWIAEAIGRSSAIVELPDWVGGGIARLGFLPGAPITRDQWAMLQSDNVVPAGAEGIEAFGIDPVPLATVAPGWLVLYRRHGRFATPPA